MSCNNYTATQIPVSVGFDANGNAGSLVETKEIKVTKIETPTDADQLIIAAGTEVVFKGNVTVEGTINVGAVEAASSLSSLTDVTITSVANGEVLVWSSNDWINRTLSEAGIVATGDLANYATTASLTGYVPTGTLSNYVQTTSLNNYVATASIGVTVQAQDPVLDALSLATVTANTIPYFNTGAAATNTPLTNLARTLLDDSTVGAMQQTLEVRPGIEVQTQNTSLQDIADINTGSLVGNEVLAWGGSNWLAVAAPGGSPVALNDITDVTISTAVDNDFLVYNGTNWVDEDPSVARTSLGATTVGANIFTLTNPTAVRYLKINADNSVSTRTAAEMRTDLTAQEQNSTLTNIATQTPTANTIIYFDNSVNAATTNLTSFGRSLLDDSTAAECRGTLGAQGSDVALDAISTLTDSSGASAFGALLCTLPADDIYNSLPRILPVILPDKVNIGNNYGKILRFLDLESPTGGTLGFPQWSTLSLGELDNVDITGAGGNLTAGRILYVNTSQDLTELANPGGDSFLKHNGTTPSWRSAADVKSDLGLATGSNVQFNEVSIGSTDTTITRSSAGNIQIEGKAVYCAGGSTPVAIADGGTGVTTAPGDGQILVGQPGNTFSYESGSTLRATVFPSSPSNGDLIFYNGTDFAYLKKPSSNGTYKLRIVVSDESTVLSWAADGG
jgi:hypothetical protein